ncbi:MAG: hypothetical protein HYV51_03410 [Parcubacteria group bacterium]|nr:hypothetical protein [Parcubacteria group bacterium]
MSTILPENYPSRCGGEKIEEIIHNLESEARRTNLLDNSIAHTETVKYSSLIQLGQMELMGRFTKKYSLLALGVAILSIILSGIALYYAKIQAAPVLEQSARNERQAWDYCKSSPGSIWPTTDGDKIGCSEVLKMLKGKYNN